MGNETSHISEDIFDVMPSARQHYLSILEKPVQQYYSRLTPEQRVHFDIDTLPILELYKRLPKLYKEPKHESAYSFLTGGTYEPIDEQDELGSVDKWHLKNIEDYDTLSEAIQEYYRRASPEEQATIDDDDSPPEEIYERLPAMYKNKEYNLAYRRSTKYRRIEQQGWESTPKSIQGRIHEYESIKHVLGSLTYKNTCYIPHLSHERFVDGKNNLAYFLWIDPVKLSGGSYGSIHAACVVDKLHNRCGVPLVIRIPKGFSSDRVSVCKNDYKLLIFSRVAALNIMPNFPLVVDSYMCSDSTLPITVQERAKSDLVGWVGSNTDNFTDLVSIIVQLLLTLHFIHINGVIHFDMKAANVLIDDLQDGSVLRYQTGGGVMTLPTGVLAMITDWDMALFTDEEKIKDRADMVAAHYLDYYGPHNTEAKIMHENWMYRSHTHMLDIIFTLMSIYDLMRRWKLEYQEWVLNLLRESIYDYKIESVLISAAKIHPFTFDVGKQDPTAHNTNYRVPTLLNITNPELIKCMEQKPPPPPPRPPTTKTHPRKKVQRVNPFL